MRIQSSGSSTANGYVQSSMQWLDDLYSTNHGVASTAAMTGSQCEFHGGFEDKNMNQPLQTPLEDIQYFDFTEALKNPDGYWKNNLASEVDANMLPLEMPMGQESNHASSIDTGELLSCGQTPSSESSEPDCVTGAIDILRRLQISQIRAAADESQSSMTSALSSELTMRMQIASSAVNRLSTILVCPCSQKTYVAILVAAVCMAILDTYDSLFQQTQAGLGSSLPMTSQSSVMDSVSSLPMDIENMMAGPLDPTGKMDLDMHDFDDCASSVQVLDELSKLANVVMQFSRRYKGDNRIQTNTLAALADSLKLRLRLVTNEALQKVSAQ